MPFQINQGSIYSNPSSSIKGKDTPFKGKNAPPSSFLNDQAISSVEKHPSFSNTHDIRSTRDHPGNTTFCYKDNGAFEIRSEVKTETNPTLSPSKNGAQKKTTPRKKSYSKKKLENDLLPLFGRALIRGLNPLLAILNTTSSPLLTFRKWQNRCIIASIPS